MPLQDLLSGGIAAMLNDVLGEGLLPVTLRRPTRAADGQGGFLPSYSAHAGKGFVEDYSDMARRSGIPGSDRKIVVLAKSLDLVPLRDDEVTVRGATYKVVEVRSDPALATYELQVR